MPTDPLVLGAIALGLSYSAYVAEVYRASPAPFRAADRGRARMNAVPVLEVRGLTKAYGNVGVLRGIDLAVHEHKAVALIGASGSGKSTLLRCLDLLEELDDGDVLLDGEVVTDPACDPVGVRRKLGMVFQSFNLFPHLTVLENIVLAPVRTGRVSRVEATELATHEMGFAREAADEVCFLSDGVIVERGAPAQLFTAPEHESTQRFLRRLLEARRL